MFAGDLIQVIVSPINSRDICLHIPALVLVQALLRATLGVFDDGCQWFVSRILAGDAKFLQGCKHYCLHIK